MANLKLEEIEGIGPATAQKLAQASITTTDQLLDKGSDKKGRAEIAAASGVTEKQVLVFVNMADLFRVKGIAGEYAELLKGSGVDTVAELGQRRADNLAKKMAEVNAEKNLTRKVPSETVVAGWIEQAKALPRKVNY